MRLSEWVLALCAVVPLGVSVADDTFRCGNRLIEPGMTRAEVLALCGEPTSKSVEVQDVRSGNQVVGKTEVRCYVYCTDEETGDWFKGRLVRR